MNNNENKAWALIDADVPVQIDDKVRMWLKSMSNGQKILLAQAMQETRNFDGTMKLLAQSVSKIEINGEMIEDNARIVDIFVHLDSFKTQNKILDAALSITDLKDVERKNSPSSSAT